MTNLLTRVPKCDLLSLSKGVSGDHGAHHLPADTPQEAHAQLGRVLDQLREPFLQVATMLDDAGAGILAFTGIGALQWQKLRSNTPWSV